MYNNILVALNNKDRSIKAFDQAIELAKVLGANLFAISIIEQYDEIDELPEDELYAVQMLLDKMHQKYNYPFISEIKSSKNTALTIAEFADENNCDLIILGSRRLPGARSIVMRSTTNAVLSACQKPVLII